MNSLNVGIEEARGRLGDLVTAAQQGTDIILTRRGRPAARIVAIKEPAMTYTVEIQASNADGTIWQNLAPAETVIDPVGCDDAEALAQAVAVNQSVADGDNWRVCVWNGADADTGTEPDAVFDGGTLAAEDERDVADAAAALAEPGESTPAAELWAALPGAEYGILTDYTTGEALRAATAEEHARSLAAGETGAYQDDDGRSVFVAGGPES